MKTQTTTATADRLKISASFKAFLERNYDDCRVSRLLYTAANSPHRSASLIVTDALNYLTNRTDGLISYLPKGKECRLNADGLWSRASRQEGKPARVMGRLLSPHVMRMLKQADLERFASLYSAFTYLHSYVSVQHVSGEAIASIYAHEVITFSSCMNRAPAEWLKIYIDNPQVVSMLAMFDRREGEKLIGRAIVWKLPDGRKFCDRIYGQNMDCVEYLKAYAMEQGMIVKPRQTFEDKNEFQRPDGSLFTETITIPLKTNFDHFPYLDTFTYGGNGYLTNVSQGHKVTPYRYTCTEGRRYEIVTDIHGQAQEVDECVWSNYHGGYIRECEAREVDGDWYDTSEIEEDVYIFVNGQRFLMRDCTYATVYTTPNGLEVEGSHRNLSRLF